MPFKDQRTTGRRDALRKIALGTGAVTALPILGQGAVQSHREQAARPNSVATPAPDLTWKPLFFDERQNETVIALADLIIPATDTPGAKAALVNRYMDLELSEDDAAKKKSFVEGLAWLDARSRKLHGKLFLELSAHQQTELLTPLADPENKNPEDKIGVDFFQQVKDFTIFAYYTSKPGMEQELEYGGDDYHTDFPGACTHPEHQT